MNKIHGQILRVLKDILLSQPLRSSGNCSFYAGRPGPFGHSSYSAKWWFSEEYRVSLRKLVTLIQSEIDQYKSCDEESISRSIQDALQLICMDDDIFEPGFLMGYPSLFDRITKGREGAAAEKILNEITSIIDSGIEDAVCVYLLPSISAKSFYIPEEEIHFISSGDQKYFKELQDSGIAPKKFDIESGEIEDSSLLIGGYKFESILLIRTRGSMRDVEAICEDKIRRFVAIVFAKVRSRVRYPISRSSMKVSRGLIQFVHIGTPKEDYRYSSIGSFAPPHFKGDFELPQVVTKKVRHWYSARKRDDTEVRNRRYIAAHYINLGLNAKAETSFIHYFIALDALFGVRGSVEKSILDGVESMKLAGGWLDKTKWLYDLRNSLVHGGCRSIHSWEKYSKYRDHFKSEPLLDLEKLSCISLIYERKDLVINEMKSDA